MTELLSVLALGRPQADTLAWTALFLSAALISGRIMRLGGPPALLMGFLTLMGGTDLALYLSRALATPLWLFPLLALAAIVAIALFARLALPAPAPDSKRCHFLYVPVIVILCWSCWLMAVLTPDPSAGYAIYQGWTPLYARAALNLGFFPMPEDMNLGVSYLSSALYYALDVQGMAILGAVLLPLDAYAAYNGAVIAGCMAALAAMAWTVRHSWPGLIVYLVMGLVFYRYGHFFRLVMGNNWGDIGLVTGGTAIAAFATAMPGRQRAALWMGFAATFLVFSRNFGAAYAAVVLLAGFLYCRCRPFPVWFGLGAVLTVFAAKEVLQVWNHGLFFPVASRMAGKERDWGQTVIGTLHDWGILPEPALLGLPLGALWPAIIAGVWLAWTRRNRWHRQSVSIVASPLLCLTAPLLVEVVTGYRMSVQFSKLYILGLLLFPWLPARLLAWNPHIGHAAWPLSPRLSPTIVVTMLVVAVAAPSAWLLRYGPLAAVESYRDNNTDLQIARKILAAGSDISANVRDHRVLYFYHEPGLTLRYFLGGDMSNDYDFYSDRVAAAAQGGDLAHTLAELGWPSLYFSYGFSVPHAHTTGYDHTLRLAPEIEHLVHRIPGWAEHIIRHGSAVLIIPKRTAP
ncbi:MAG: hypothetical protein FD176_274 [Rhodospirillaceae bacterium]|nr:MAG: hypothetical protein FD176_274 [Rhodospirillaceae bacterium]TNC97476.1 MAG: hypothetical protein FD119_1076 [Stygiobacter sp.]